MYSDSNSYLGLNEIAVKGKVDFATYQLKVKVKFVLEEDEDFQDYESPPILLTLSPGDKLV